MLCPTIAARCKFLPSLAEEVEVDKTTPKVLAQEDQNLLYWSTVHEVQRKLHLDLDATSKMGNRAMNDAVDAAAEVREFAESELELFPGNADQNAAHGILQTSATGKLTEVDKKVD